MKILHHHIYELKKGLRNLVLFTCDEAEKEDVVKILTKSKTDFLIRHTGGKTMNVFFGEKLCLNIIESIGNKSLSDYTPEEDFILGIMLGYDRKIECQRFLELKNKSERFLYFNKEIV